MIDPLAAMYAAVEAVDNKQIGEIELEWYEETDDGIEKRLVISIRKEGHTPVLPWVGDCDS